MPGTPAQRRLAQAAIHGATFKKAQDLRQSMTMKQLLDFAEVKRPSKPAKKSKKARNYGQFWDIQEGRWPRTQAQGHAQ